MASIFIFRHGETQWNNAGRFQGHTDIPLNETGLLQAKALSRPLTAFNPEVILSSDLTRAVQTAQFTADALKIPIIKTKELREAHLGHAEGLLMAEIFEKFSHGLAEEWRSYDSRYLDIRYPGGESGREIIARVTGAIESFVKKNSYSRIGVSTHGGVIRRLFQYFLMKQSKGHSSEPVPIPNGIIYRVEFDPHAGSWEIPNFSPWTKD